MARSAARKESQHETLLDVLKHEHREVKALLEEIVETDSAEEREELFSKFMPAMIAHSHAEAEVFYPLLKKEEKSKVDAIEGFVEHNLVEQLIEELSGMKQKDDEEWSARCNVLKEMIEHHIKEEESTIFKDAREILGKEKLEELVPRFEKAKEKHLS